MKNIIYGLRDPRNDVYQYIGKSTVGKKRPLKHLTNSHSPKVNEWVKTLGENWLYPIIDVIEEVDNIDDLAEREEYWINYYNNINPDLLNVQKQKQIVIQNFLDEDDEKDFQFFIQKLHRLPDLLRKERLCRKIKQEDMAKHMGVARSTVSLCERGENVTISIIQKYIITLKGLDILTKSYGERARSTG